MFSLEKQQCKLDSERWSPIPGYEGLYEVSDSGRIKSFYTSNKIGFKFLKPVLRDDGYFQVHLFKNKKSRIWLIHRAVLFAFSGYPDEGKEGAHLDGNKANNSITNLAWVTSKENNMHKVKHGTSGTGEDNAMAILTETDVREIRSLYKPRSRVASCCALGRKFGVSYQAIWDIIKFRRWKHVI